VDRGYPAIVLTRQLGHRRTRRIPLRDLPFFAVIQHRLAAEDSASRLRPLDPLVAPRSNQLAFKLGHPTHDRQDQLAMRCGRIQPRVFQRLDVCASRLDLVQQSEQIADRSRQAIEPDHDQRVARFQRVQRLLQRVPPIRALGRYLLGKELLAARRLELIDLAVEILSVARNSRLADAGHLNPPLWNADIRNTNIPTPCGVRGYSVR
jgi:hypothetical protein